MAGKSASTLRAENEELRLRLEEAQQALEAIRAGEVDSLVVEGPDGPRVFALEGTGHAYRIFVQAMAEGAVTVSEHGTVLYCNARFARMVDTPLERVIGTSIEEWIPQRLHATFGAMLQRNAEGDVREDLRLLTHGGEEIAAHVSASAIHDDGRRVLCLVVTDLRERKRSEERYRTAVESLREADPCGDEFLAALSHDLRNPLAAIQNGLDVLDRAVPGGDQARQAQAVLHRQVARLVRLVDDLATRRGARAATSSSGSSGRG